MNRRKNPAYVPEPRTIRHVDAFFKMLEAVSGERGLVEEVQRQQETGKEPRTMKDFFEERDKIRDKIVKAKSKAEGIRALMGNLGWSEEEALDRMNLAGEEREAVRKALYEQKIA